MSIENSTHFLQVCDELPTSRCHSKVRTRGIKITETLVSVLTEDDVEVSIDTCNFEKGMGLDMFIGGVLNIDKAIRDNFKKLAVSVLNGAQPIPVYLNQGRLIALSKTSKPTVTCD